MTWFARLGCVLLLVAGPGSFVAGREPAGERPQDGARQTIFPAGALPRSFEEFFERQFGPGEDDAELLEAVEIPVDEERKFGQSLVEAFRADLKRQKLKLLSRGREHAYLVRLVELVRPQMRNAARYPKIEVWLVDAPQPDARSFPGGTLFFFRGILELAPNEAAIVAVVGHELSHLDHGHQLLPLRRTRLFEKSFHPGTGFDPQQFFSQAATMTRLVSRPFRPEDETAADRDGVTWAHSLGYDPRELAELIRRMHVRDRGRELPLPSFLRTHPYRPERIDDILDVARELDAEGGDPALYVGRENLKRRITRDQREFPE